MTKSEAIRLVNKSLGANRLSTRNTHWSNVVAYGSGEGWWLNVPFRKFSQDLNLLLNTERDGEFLHLTIPANAIRNPEQVFRNKAGTADIFMPIAGRDRLIDMQSGSARQNFANYVVESYQY